MYIYNYIYYIYYTFSVEIQEKGWRQKMNYQRLRNKDENEDHNSVIFWSKKIYEKMEILEERDLDRTAGYPIRNY